IYGFYEGQRPIIVVSDFETINDVIVRKTDHFNARARMIMTTRKEGPHTLIVEARGPHWKRMRALGSMAFTNKSLRNIHSTVEQSANMMVEGMAQQQGEINTLDFFQEYTLDIICKVALGMRDVKMFNNEFIESLRGAFGRPLRNPLNVIPALFPFAVDEIIMVFRQLPKILPFKFSFFILLSMLRKNIAQRKKEREENGNTETSDFIDMFLDAEVDVSEVQFGEESDTSKKLSNDEIVGQCLVFLLAGFDTTSNSLAYITHFLANNEGVQKKLIEEVDSFLLENENIEFERLNDLKYMDAVIKESLRHYPLGSVVVTRECTKACEIGGFKFEVGDSVATDTWTMHMDKSVWGEDAEE
ncbi:hypothetical protein PFISCL1PPCAC_13503, partial [Pristionchus fissidentatus]